MARPYLGGSGAGVEALAETKTLGVADSGKVFICSQAAAYDITLPAVTAKGWTAKFILGTAGANDFDIIDDLIKGKDIIVFEDNCESMGAEYRGKQAGTFGIMGTFSTFYSPFFLFTLY